ncbi:MAG: hypothetical protein ACPH3I_01255 [Porticoccaceae bacterium]|uniref:hypothetical protein n=1 Tax=Neptunomonas phycophila TaxID=1572645 RepID=UPI0035166B27
MKTVSLVLAGLTSTALLPRQLSISHSSSGDVFKASISPQTAWALTERIAPLRWINLYITSTENRNASSSICGLKRFLYSVTQIFDKPSSH